MKIQSKLRTISEKQNSLVDIPREYVSDNFVLFLYINRKDENETLYIFFKEDFKNWTIYKDCFRLGLSEKSLMDNSDKIFSQNTVEILRKKLISQEIKNYTSIIIDGIFLEKALRDTRLSYSKIWPDKKFIKPSLEKVIKDLLRNNRFTTPSNSISCILFLSDHHNIESEINLPSNLGVNKGIDHISYTIHNTDQIISFQLLEQLRRTVNAENIILVADDINYEKELNELTEKGVNLILLKQRHHEGSRMYTAHAWQDISYSLGRSIGLEGWEI